MHIYIYRERGRDEGCEGQKGYKEREAEVVGKSGRGMGGGGCGGKLIVIEIGQLISKYCQR